MARTIYDHRYLPQSGGFKHNIVTNTIDHLSLMISVAQERNQLRSLDAKALKDMGLDAADVQRELQRSFWDLPKSRLG